jgi:uncharacterized protein YggT (Ycf19 family)
MMFVLAISRVDVARYVETLIYLYIALIFVRVLVSFAPRIPAIPALRAFLNFTESVTDPFLNFFRAILPSMRMGPAAIDLSPMVATLVLIVGGLYFVVPLIAG